LRRGVRHGGLILYFMIAGYKEILSLRKSFPAWIPSF
jgi:hypothetical protein